MFPCLRIVGQDNYMKTFLLTLIIFISGSLSAHALMLSLEQTSDISTGQISFDVMLNTEGTSVNAFSGAVSIPVDQFEIESISTAGSVSVLWLTKPALSEERDINGRKRIPFEGMFPGGFDGVRSPFYEDTRPGKLFSVTLRPVAAGKALILLENVDIRAHDGQATKLAVTTEPSTIFVPDPRTLPKVETKKKTPIEISNSSLQGFLSKDESVASGRWMLTIYDDITDRSASGYFVAESKTSDPRGVRAYEWKKATQPYVLKNQWRNRFIHIKALYDDASYSFTTIAPVENASDSSLAWRILVMIAAALIFLYVFYARRK